MPTDELRAAIERVEHLLKHATPAPWGWHSYGEKVSAASLGTYFKTDDTCAPIGGYVTMEKYDEKKGEYVDVAMQDGSIAYKDDNASFIDLDLIAELRNIAPQLLSLARQALERPVAGLTADGVTVRLGQEVWKYSVLTSRAERLWACFAGFVAKEHETGTVSILEYKACECFSTESAARTAGAKP